jgi:simple sugar transport system permease protein
MTVETISNILFATLRVATPLLLAGMAGLISQRVNLLNIALDGLMLFGAFFAVVFGSLLGSPWWGLLFAVLFTLLINFLFAIVVVQFKANLIVAGLAINTLALGLTSYLLVILFNSRGAYSPKGLMSLPKLSLPLIQEIPILGNILSGHGVLVYVSWVMVVVIGLLLYRTPLGLHIRAVGEHKESAETAGIKVKAVQYIALTISGALAAIAGAQLSIGNLALFTDNMINGRGFIALAAVFFGGARPGLTVVGCILFGLFEILQFRLQTTTKIPPQLPQMLPYIIVVMTLTIISIQKRLRKKVNA